MADAKVFIKKLKYKWMGNIKMYTWVLIKVFKGKVLWL